MLKTKEKFVELSGTESILALCGPHGSISFFFLSQRQKNDCLIHDRFIYYGVPQLPLQGPRAFGRKSGRHRLSYLHGNIFTK